MSNAGLMADVKDVLKVLPDLERLLKKYGTLEALATGENRHLLDLVTTATQRKFIHFCSGFSK